jgi:hypothetical protein
LNGIPFCCNAFRRYWHKGQARGSAWLHDVPMIRLGTIRLGTIRLGTIRLGTAFCLAP